MLSLISVFPLKLDCVWVVFYSHVNVNILLPIAIKGISFLSEELVSQCSSLVVKVGDGSEETRVWMACCEGHGTFRLAGYVIRKENTTNCFLSSVTENSEILTNLI